MSADGYDQLKKVQLQRLARARGLDPEGTVAVLKDRLRVWDEEQDPEEPDAAYDAEEDDAEEEDGEEEGDDEEEGEEEEEDPAAMALAVPGEGLKEGYFRYTVHAGNSAFFQDPLWHAANEEMAIIRAGESGYKHLRSMGAMEYLVEGNDVHYQFPVERQ